MGIANKLTQEITAWVVLIMVVVVASIVLVNFKEPACSDGFTFNVSANNCFLATNVSITETPTVFTTIDTAVTGFQEPANWVDIVIISLIGAGIIAMFFVLFNLGKGGSSNTKLKFEY